MRPAFLVVLVGLTACREDPRIAGMEDLANQACACATAECAAPLTARILDSRGLEQEDYANLPANQLARYDTARSRGAACLAVLTPIRQGP